LGREIRISSQVRRVVGVAPRGFTLPGYTVAITSATIDLRRTCRTGSRSRPGRGRKVRSPQGSVPANSRGDALKARFTESATENIPPDAGYKPAFGKGEKVR